MNRIKAVLKGRAYAYVVGVLGTSPQRWDVRQDGQTVASFHGGPQAYDQAARLKAELNLGAPSPARAA